MLFRVRSLLGVLRWFPYEQEVDNAVATLSTLIEPIMIVIMGAIAGAVIFALYLPTFTLGQAIKDGTNR